MQKRSALAIGLVLIVIVIIAAYFIYHKSSPYKPSTASSYSSSTSNSTSGQATTAVNNAVLKTKISANLGSYLIELNGDALYTYGGDSKGVSNCTGSCLSNWPAYQDSGSTSGLPEDISTIKRTDNGEIQYTYKGMPLYTFVGDSQGSVTGNGVSDFSVAKP